MLKEMKSTQNFSGVAFSFLNVFGNERYFDGGKFMRIMTAEERKQIEDEITRIMRSATSDDYARYILEDEDEVTKNTLMEDIIQNVLETSAWEDEGYYNEDDIRLAIGRELMTRLGIDY